MSLLVQALLPNVDGSTTGEQQCRAESCSSPAGFLVGDLHGLDEHGSLRVELLCINHLPDEAFLQ